MIFNPSLLRPQPTQLQIITDLHLDRIPIYNLSKWFNSFILPKDQAYMTILIVTGDICSFPKKNKLRVNKLVKALTNYRRVIFVPGNHDFYGMTIPEGKLWWDIVTAGSNIRVLYNEFYDFFDIRIVGSTLWSFIPPQNELATLFAINDFKYILNQQKEPITIQEYNNMYSTCANYLGECLDSNPQHLTIVATHYPPIEFDPKGHYDSQNPLFLYYNNKSPDLEELASTHPKAPNFWFWGHTHIRGTAPSQTETSVGSNPLVSYEDSWDTIPEPGELVTVFSLTKSAK